MAPKGRLKNGMNLTQFDTWRIHGRVEEQEFGLNNIISIYLDDPARIENHDIIYFLSILLRSNDVDAVLDMLEEFKIPVEQVNREELNAMCDISVGMYNIGEEAGIEKGQREEQIKSIRNLLRLGQNADQIINTFHYPEPLVMEVLAAQWTEE